MTEATDEERALTVDEVVVGWRPGAQASVALEWALQRIDRLHATLSLVAATPAAAPETEAELAAVADRVRAEHPGVEVRARTVVGDPVKELAALTAPRRVVVVGTGRRRGMALRYSFSFGARLAARAQGPVALIPVGGLPVAGGVVVGVDGTPESIRAARLAARVAASRGEELIVAHVWQEPTPWQDAYVAPDDGFLESLAKLHQDILDETVAAFAGDYPEVTVVKRLVHGQPAWGLLDQAAQASLLVVGSHSLRGVQRFFLGSVSHSVVLNLEGPTIVVPAR